MPESSQDLSNKVSETSVADDSVSGAQNSAYPGRILSAAREELNYSVEQVAQELHLRPSVVLAMEEEKYKEFSSEVFLKGYFRSYCRLVNLHESRMVDLLESQLKGMQKDIDDAAYIVKKEQQTQKRKKAIIGLLIAALIIGTLAVLVSLYYGNMEETVQIEAPVERLSDSYDSMSAEPSDKTVTAAVAINEPSIQTTIAQPSKSVNLNTNEQNGTAELSQLSGQTENASTPIKKTLAPREEKDAPGEKLAVNSENNARDKLSNVEPVSDSDTASVIEAVTENLPIKLSAFEAVFSGDCWFKLVDGNQKTVFAALKRDGNSVSYSGIPPFNVVLGDASKVVLSFNGEMINLKSHTANNGRAQITLNEG